MVQIERWWAEHALERYWLEVSARGSDVGVDLNAPTTNEVGRPFWSYDLLREVADGDVVLHYDRDQQAVVAWSWAVGRAWPDTVVWAARGTFARGQNIQPHERPGLRVSLRGAFPLAAPLTLDRIREEEAALRVLRKGRTYFPFELGSRPPRPMQGYLFKLPLGFIDLFAQLDDVPRFSPADLAPVVQSVQPASIGRDDQEERPDYQPRNENLRSRAAQPWSRDPSEVDRALSAHARIERLIAEAAAAEGWRACAYGRGDPVFDLLLQRDDGAPTLVLVEVKSTTATNEEKQLRLALGQVLRYQYLLQPRDGTVAAFVAIEGEPRDVTWIELCSSAGVVLVWPATVGRALRDLAS